MAKITGLEDLGYVIGMRMEIVWLTSCPHVSSTATRCLRRRNTVAEHGNHLVARLMLRSTASLPTEDGAFTTLPWFDHHLEKNTWHRPKGRKQAVFDEDLLNDALSLYDWRVAEDPTEDYELLLKGLRTCADALVHYQAEIPASLRTPMRCLRGGEV
ncbi:unnamed protein product [Nippostrongylus brasiliensis]|uniref:DUF5623 domain-containing protein n=1 Tax=Nippostrongylus brasiliensis TaxID=27835 RepID=A0A0N4YKF9_NIPBR|nr:unnamed protein product [Nippostrongylus brasiliensis]